MLSGTELREKDLQGGLAIGICKLLKCNLALKRSISICTGFTCSPAREGILWLYLQNHSEPGIGTILPVLVTPSSPLVELYFFAPTDYFSFHLCRCFIFALFIEHTAFTYPVSVEDFFSSAALEFVNRRNLQKSAWNWEWGKASTLLDLVVCELGVVLWECLRL